MTKSLVETMQYHAEIDQYQEFANSSSRVMTCEHQK